MAAGAAALSGLRLLALLPKLTPQRRAAAAAACNSCAAEATALRCVCTVLRSVAPAPFAQASEQTSPGAEAQARSWRQLS